MDMPDNAEYDYDTKLLLIDGEPMPWPITNVRLDTAPNKISTVTVEIPVHSINAQVFGPRVMLQNRQSN